MRMRQVTVALLIQLAVLSVPAPARSQSIGVPMPAQFVDTDGGLSLDAAIAQALEREPGFRAVRTDIEVAQGKVQQAGLRPNPGVSLEYRGEPAGTDNQTTAQIQWPLELFRRSPRVAVSTLEQEVTQRTVDDRARFVAADVRSRYGAAAAAVRDLALADRAVDLLSRQFELARQRAAEGAIPALERDQLEVEVHRYEAERLLAGGRVEAAFVDLKRMMGLGPEAPLRLRDTLELLVPPPIDRGPESPPAIRTVGAAASRPDVQMADAQMRLAASRVDSAGADGRFDISLFGGYTRMDAGFPQRGINDSGGFERVRGVFHYASAGAMLTLPLGNRNQGEIAAARAEQSGAKLRLESAQLSAQAEIASAQAREAATRRALALTESTVTLAGRNLDVVRQAYELGRTTVNDVVLEQRKFLEIERARTETMRAVYEAHAALLLVRGER